MTKKFSFLIPLVLVAVLVFAFMSDKPSPARMYIKAPQLGDTAPDLSLANANGVMYKLSDLRGKIVLVDFWASWCGPCRKENPNLVRTYDNFHNARFKNAKEFTIYSVSLDNNEAPWLKAIKKDDLKWDYHVSDLMGWDSPAAATYGVEAIPSNFLLDEKGVIVGINLRGKKLDEALKALQ